MARVVKNTDFISLSEASSSRLSPTQRMVNEAWANTAFKIGLFVFGGLILAALIYPEVSSIDPTKMNIRSRFVPPLFMGEKWTWAHPFGTDHLGRDLFLRCLVGLRWSVLIGCASVLMNRPGYSGDHFV